MDHFEHTPIRASGGPASRPVEVAAGVVFRNGELLITQRYPDSHLGGLWEFPGGKREPGETFESALVRELREELGVKVSVGALIETVEHTYPEKTVRVQFHHCRIREGEPRALGCHAIKWIRRTELCDHRFPEADSHLLQLLAREDRFWLAASTT